MATVTLALVALLAWAASASAAGWQTSRSTYYGTDAWSIHTGSCGYGYLAGDVGTGWDIAALSDSSPDYRGSCGKCKEVKCLPGNFADGYGAWLDRSNVCYNPQASVVVMVTDTCPCSYPGNAFSNKRWCCGDMYHLDLSIWAFEKLADTKWGVIKTQSRDVSCNTRPRIAARKPWGKATGMPSYYRPPAGWSRAQDRRPKRNN